MRRELAGAQPEKVARVLAMVDALPERGDADALIAPLRERLAAMHVARPLSLSRLLFVPLEPVLVAGPRWRRGAPGVPRTALRCFARAIRHGLGEEAGLLDARLAGHTLDQHAVVRAVGTTLWPRAAAILLAVAVPDDWQGQTGLAAPDFAALTRVAACVLDLAPALAEAIDPSDTHASTGGPAWPSLVEAMLAQPQACDAAALASAVAVMLARAPRPETVLEALRRHKADAGRAALRGMCEDGVGFALQSLTAAAIPPDLATASAETHRHATLLDDLSAWVDRHPSQRAGVDAARRTLDVACRAHFAEAAQQRLAIPADPPTEAAVVALEQSARDLRRFERAGRRLGGGSYYDAALRAAATRFAGTGGLARMDRVRLVELLAGPEAALAVLRGT